MASPDLTLVNVSLPVVSEESKKQTYTPLGCLYLISYLEQHGIRVDFRDYQIFCQDVEDELVPTNLVKLLEGSSPVIGISCMVSMLPFVLIGAREYKAERPDCKIILGGPGPSGVADAIISNLPWIDIVVKGEGEETLLDVVEAIRGNSSIEGIPGITYRDSDGVHSNPPRRRIHDLDRLRFPAYDRVDLSKYDKISIITGRGCPHRCSFCDVAPLWHNKTQLRSVESVYQELDELRYKFKVKEVHIADDTFCLNRKRTLEFCRLTRPLGLKWSCLSRIDTIDEELLGEMADAGCDAIFFGIESGSEKVLSRIKKTFRIQEALEKVEVSTRYFSKVVTSFIWGFPFESVDDFRLTLISMISAWQSGARVGLKLLSPMPLSELGIEYKDRLEFSESLCSVFASLGYGGGRTKGDGNSMPDNFKSMILAYPDIFQGLYHIKSETLSEKMRLLEQFCTKFGIEFS